MSTQANIRVGKLDAVRRQLEAAVQLYFYCHDHIPIHTLAAASYDIIRVINKKLGRPNLNFDIILDLCADDKERREIANYLRAPQNFLKHADRDIDEYLEFKPFYTEILLYESCLAFSAITGEEVPSLAVYRMWFIALYCETLDKTPELIALANTIRKEFPPASRRAFFESYLPRVIQEQSLKPLPVG